MAASDSSADKLYRFVRAFVLWFVLFYAIFFVAYVTVLPWLVHLGSGQN
jgi:hypothetical protein